MLILCVSSCISNSLLVHTSCASNPAVLPATNFLDTVSLSIEYHSSSWIRAASLMFPRCGQRSYRKSLPQDGAQMSPRQSGRQLQDRLLTCRTSLRDPHGEDRSKQQKFRHTHRYAGMSVHDAAEIKNIRIQQEKQHSSFTFSSERHSSSTDNEETSLLKECSICGGRCSVPEFITS